MEQGNIYRVGARTYAVAQMKLEEVKPLIAQLSPHEKAELLKELVGRDSGLQVVLGGSNWTTAEIAIQIQTASSVDLSVLLEAVAERLRSQKKVDLGSNGDS